MREFFIWLQMGARILLIIFAIIAMLGAWGFLLIADQMLAVKVMGGSIFVLIVLALLPLGAVDYYDE